ncbi:aldo/keto reductase [Spelaeicoccus albus]
MPAVGFGTYPLTGQEATDAVSDAIDIGYRLIDTAVNYRNEEAVGRAIAASGVPRDELRITTKLPGRDHGYRETLRSCRESLQRLGLDYLDMYLIHWPLPKQNRYIDTWRAFRQLQQDGLVRSIGVSNFAAEHLAELEREGGTGPAVNQIEVHPFFPQPNMLRVNSALGIVTQSWSPLGRASGVVDDDRVTGIADAHSVTPAQVVLRWHVQRGAVPIPKSGTPERRRANLDVFSFTLSDDEMSVLSAMETGRLGGDPDVHEEF